MGVAQWGDDWDALLRRAGQVLSRTLGGEVTLGEPERLTDEGRRNLLLRCRVVSAPQGSPTSLVLKQAHREEYRPEDPGSWAARGFFRDWAGLQFLGEAAGDATGCPRFYGGDREVGFVLMEDLGAGEDLAHRLLEGTAGEAEEGLLLLAEVLGRMHAATGGREAEYLRIRGALSAWGDESRARLMDEAQEVRGKIEEICASLGVNAGDAFGADVERIGRAIGEPGPFLAYTHGDPCPDNTLLRGGALRLFDYEFGRYRHALLDGVYGRIRFPTCWCVGDIPEAVVDRMEAAYRKELAAGCPAAEDDLYGKAVTEACGYWLLDLLNDTLETALESEDETWGIATRRQRLVRRLGAFADLSERAGHLPGLCDVSRALLDHLRTRWAGEPVELPMYPAFSIVNS